MRLEDPRQWRRLSTLVATILLFAAMGCGNGRCPVSGRVTYDDGSPVTEGNVIGQMGEGGDSVTVQGNVSSSGTFTWGTEKPGDGAKPGKYRVAVIGRGLGDEEMARGLKPAIDLKYANPATSGIEFEVKDGRNELNIKVTKPGAKSR